MITRSIKKKQSKEVESSEDTIDINEEDEGESLGDDLDDLFHDLDDFDALSVSEDEFDDLLDDF